MSYHEIDWEVKAIIALLGILVALLGVVCYGSMEVTEGDPHSDTPEWEVTMNDGTTYQVICYEKMRWASAEEARSWDMKIIDPVTGNPTWIKYNPLNVVTIKRL